MRINVRVAAGLTVAQYESTGLPVVGLVLLSAHTAEQSPPAVSQQS